MKTWIASFVLCVLILAGFALGVSHSTAQTIVDWRTVVASITYTHTPQPMTPTATMDKRYTWTPTVPFVVRTGVPVVIETATPFEVQPIYYVTVEVTRLVPYYIIVTATPRIVEPVLPQPDIPTFIVPNGDG